MMNTSYKSASADIIFEEFDGDLVVLNLATGKYFGFNATAAAIWTAMMSQASPTDIVDVGFDEKAIWGFVEKLIEFELIIPDLNTKSELGSVEKSVLAENVSAPTVEVYEDLADLIVADPIHDVDQETGWPHMPKSG